MVPLKGVCSLVERKKRGARERTKWRREEKSEGEEPEDLPISLSCSLDLYSLRSLALSF